MVEIEIVLGTGRGKTTNAIGKAIKCLIDNKTVTVIQFLKTGNECGECNFIKSKFILDWITIGKEKFFVPQKNEAEFREFIGEQLSIAKKNLKHKNTDVLILDELGFVLYYNLIKIEDILPLIEQTIEKVIITGRLVPIELSGKYSEVIIKEITHPFQRGILAREGIDY